MPEPLTDWNTAWSPDGVGMNSPVPRNRVSVAPLTIRSALGATVTEALVTGVLVTEPSAEVPATAAVKDTVP